MTASAEQAALLADPTTSAATLQSLAAADPDLWPTIAAHPNVYPDLLTWMHENGLPTTPSGGENAPDAVGEPLPQESAADPDDDSDDDLEGDDLDDEDDTDPDDEDDDEDDEAGEDARPTETLTAALPPAYRPTPTRPTADPFVWRSWVSAHRKVLIAVGGGIAAAILALVLVVNLIVVPQQRAAEAAAEAAAALEAAIDDFNTAKAACSTANSQYKTTMAAAERKTEQDPTALADPTLIDALRAEITLAEDTELCEAPAVADEIDDVEDQTLAIKSDTRAVRDAEGAVKGAIDAVDRSIVERREAAEAAAAAAAQAAAAAEVAARTWTMTDPQGFSFTASLVVAAPTTSYDVTVNGSGLGSSSSYSLGEACGFDPAVDIAVPVTMKVTATTQGFETPISVLTTVSQSGRVSTPHEFVVEAYYTSSVECDTPSYGTTVITGVDWEEPMSTGGTGTARFVVIIRDWRTPATPAGDTAFLDNVSMRVNGGQNSGFTTSNGQQLFLNNRVK